MGKIWLELDESDEADTFAVDFWRKQRIVVSTGAFWADETKKYKDEPEKRFSLALENLPLPAAFRESMIALRRIIGDRKKKGEPFDEELAMAKCVVCWAVSHDTAGSPAVSWAIRYGHFPNGPRPFS